MKSSLYKILATVAMPGLLAVGCGGSSPAKSTDMAMKVTSKDMAVASMCDQVSDFPGAGATGAFWDNSSSIMMDGADYADEIQGFRSNDNDPSTLDIMIIFALHTQGSPAFTVPLTHTFTGKDGPFVGSDGIGLQYYFGVPVMNKMPVISATTPLYAPTSGSITATKLDATAGGMMAVSGSNLNLVEWQSDPTNKTAGMPKAGGGCLDLASFTWSNTLQSSATDM